MNPFAKLGAACRGMFHKLTEKKEKQPKESTWRTDAFWAYRWYQDFKYKRVGLTTISWQGEEYGYRMDVERIPKKQLDEMRRSLPAPMHRSNAGWGEWVMIQDDRLSPFPEIRPAGSEFYMPTAVDLYLYMTNKDLDNALTFKKKQTVPFDGKMLLLCLVGVAVLALFMMGVFA